MKLPTILLLNGLMQYQPAMVTPLAPLADQLRAQGWRVVIDNHFQTWHADEEPVVVVGHSRGGASALIFQKQQYLNARYVPLVITLDAAPAWPCPVKGKCINIHTDYYPRVHGAENVRIVEKAGFQILHSLLANTEAAKKLVLQYTAPLASPMP